MHLPTVFDADCGLIGFVIAKVLLVVGSASSMLFGMFLPSRYGC